MRRIYILIIVFLSLMIYSCSRKHHPNRTSETSVTAEKKVAKPKPKEPIPKVITVNDSVALKSVDGRLYYDLLGHRYWKNYKDGKYYLFNKSMYTDNAFKKPE